MSGSAAYTALYDELVPVCGHIKRLAIRAQLKALECFGDESCALFLVVRHAGTCGCSVHMCRRCSPLLPAGVTSPAALMNAQCTAAPAVTGDSLDCLVCCQLLLLLLLLPVAGVCCPDQGRHPRPQSSLARCNSGSGCSWQSAASLFHAGRAAAA